MKNEINFEGFDSIDEYLDSLMDESISKEKVCLYEQKKYLTKLKNIVLADGIIANNSDRETLCRLFLNALSIVGYEEGKYNLQSLDEGPELFLCIFQDVFIDTLKNINSNLTLATIGKFTRVITSMIFFFEFGQCLEDQKEYILYFIDQCIKNIDEKLILK